MNHPRLLPAWFGAAIFAASPVAAAGLPPAVPTPHNPPARLPKPIVTAPAASPRTNTLLPSEYLPVSALHAGMSGYGLTVFRGTKIERFDVAILGVLRKINNGRDLILVKLGGPTMQRLTGIAHGMSGSPVYVNGKLIGAVSMGSQFTREPIGYVTPIEDMFDAWDPAIPQYKDLTAATTPQTVPLLQPITLKGRRFDHIAFVPPGATAPPSDNTLLAYRASTRVMVSGVSGARFKIVADALAKWGVEAQQGPGSGAAGAGIKGAPLVPGGVIGMSLATGDIDLTATGTVTYRRGDRLLAFGHPFLGVGPVAAPMFTAFVHDLEPSFNESSIIASPVTMVGSFTQDRPFSVAGSIGVPPLLVPITVHVNDRTMGRDRVFHARLLRHPQLTPVLAATAADTAIAEVHGQPGDAMATITTEVTADEVGTLRRTNRVYDAQQIDTAAVEDLQAVMSVLSSNPFYPVGIRSVKMDVTIDRGRQTAQVERIFLKQTRYEPGEMVEVGVVLKPYKQERVVRTVKVRIPLTAPAGLLSLTVQGGGSSGGGIRIGGMTFFPSGSGNDSANAATVRQLATKWEQKDRNDALVTRLSLPSSAISIQGEKLTDLPPNIDAALRGGVGGARSSGVRLERDEVKVVEQTPYVLSGGQSLAVRVVRPGGVVPERPANGADGGFSGSPDGGGVPSGSAPVPPGASSAPAPSSNGPDDLTSVTGRFPTATSPGGDNDSDDSVTVIHLSPMLASAAPPPALRASNPSGTGETAPTPRLVGRAPGLWRQASAADFRAGKLEGVTVTALGDVCLAPRLTKIAESTEPYFWCLASGDSGTLYAGSGDSGIIYRTEGSGGSLTAWVRTGELEVHSLLRTTNGTVYAGTSPHGRLFRVGPDGGKATLLQAFKEKYVLALAASPDGMTLYAATGGGGGKVYSLPIAGTSEPTVVYDGGEGSVTALAVGPDGTVYAGTAPNGLVVKIAGSGVTRPTVLYDAAEPSISGLAVGKKGVVFAATAPRGVVYRLAPGAAAQVLYDKAPGGTLTNLQISPDSGTLYTASGSTLIALPTDGDTDAVRTVDAASDIQILSVLLSGGGVWASTGNAASIYRLDAAATAGEGTLLSPVLDARATAQWGAMRWNALTPPGTSLLLQTRSGNITVPDAGWSEWSRPYSVAAGETVTSPPARYLQYRALLKGTVAATPVLRTVEVFYLPPNQAPQVALTSPHSGDVWRGTQTVRWSGSDPDRDTLQYEVTVSGDGGKTWKPLRTLRTTRPLPAPVASAASPRSLVSTAASKLRTELEGHPEISPEMRARILADAPEQVPAAITAAAPAEGSVAAATRETSLPWDTTALADGNYLLKVTASDRPSNGASALSSEKISGEFRIANRPPTLVLFRRAITVLADRSVRVEGIALHSDSVAVRGVQYRVDGTGDWQAASAQDGIFDSSSEPFFVVTTPLLSGSHRVEVQAQDEAGNTVLQTATVTVR